MIAKLFYTILLASFLCFALHADMKVDLIAICPDGGSITIAAVGLNGGLENTFLWSNGATTQMITVNEIGLYSVVVADPHGNKGTARIWVMGEGVKWTDPHGELDAIEPAASEPSN